VEGPHLGGYATMRRVQQSERIGWHVIDRGARRLELFHEQSDFPQFLTFLKYSLTQSGAVLWAYALLSNHYHLVLYASSEELCACMRRLNRLYSTYHNQKYDLAGHAFDGPYRAFRQDPSVLLRCIAYVLMNPVKAFLVNDPKDYPWTCYRQYLALPGSPMDVDLGSLIRIAGPDPKEAWKLFHRAMECEIQRPTLAYSDGLTMTAMHARQFEWLLEVARERQDHLAGETPEHVAMHWARQKGVSPKAIAKVLGISSRSVSDALYRLRGKLKVDSALQIALTPP
jgi:putative transposase